jgi:hypothetical protein
MEKSVATELGIGVNCKDDTVCVITAATGHRHLSRCIQSVQTQAHPGVSHAIVIDGAEHEQRVREAISSVPDPHLPIHVFVLPEATGKNDWLCHRIYGAMPFLVNSSWVSFLDEDNWFDSDHLSSLMAAVNSQKSLWGFALRKLVDSEGNYLDLDLCESLGSLHPIFRTPQVRLVDTNCYLLQRDLAVVFGPIWNRPRESDNRIPPDFQLCSTLIARQIMPACNMRHTVNYTLGSGPKSVKIDYFRHGNALMRKWYPKGLPWETKQPGQSQP